MLFRSRPWSSDQTGFKFRLTAAMFTCRNTKIGPLGNETVAGASVVLRLLAQLIPGVPTPGAFVDIPAATSCLAQERLLVQIGGLLFSSLLPLSVHPLLHMLAATQTCQLPVFLGTVLTAIAAIVSDFPSGPLLGQLPPLGCFCCGNWGCLVPRSCLGDRLTEKIGRASCRERV